MLKDKIKVLPRLLKGSAAKQPEANSRLDIMRIPNVRRK